MIISQVILLSVLTMLESVKFWNIGAERAMCY